MVVQLTQKYLPSSDKYDGERFITKVDGATAVKRGPHGPLLGAKGRRL